MELILKKLSGGINVEELLKAYPSLTKEDIFAVLPTQLKSSPGRSFLFPDIVADDNIDYRIIEFLRKKGIKVISIFEEARGITDKEVIHLTKEKNGILLTEDSDFGEWVFAHKIKGLSVLFLRYSHGEVDDISDTLFKVMEKFKEELDSKFIVITPKKVRVRKVI